MFVGNIHFVVLDYAYIFSVFSTFVLVLKLSNVCSRARVCVCLSACTSICSQAYVCARGAAAEGLCEYGSGSSGWRVVCVVFFFLFGCVCCQFAVCQQ